MGFKTKQKNDRIKIFITKIANSWVFATGIGTTFLTVLFFIINIIFNVIVRHKHISQWLVIVSYLLCALFSAFIAAIFFLFPAIPTLRRYFIDDNIMKEYNENSVRNKDVTERLDLIIGDISCNLQNTTDNLAGRLMMIADTLNENITASNKLINHFASCSVGRFKLILAENFFNYLDHARLNATRRVFLTSFSTRVYRPNKDFLNEEIDYCRKFKAQVRRIITIHSEEKLNIYKSMIERITKPVDNLKIAYLQIDEFDDAKLPGIIGVQIIDKEVFIMNPMTARIKNPLKNDPNKLIIINDEDAAEIFEAYYEKLWNEIESSSEKGCIDFKKDYIGYKGYILYDGEKNYSANNTIWTEIYKRIPNKNKLTIK
jgi:hypothetical protein